MLLKTPEMERIDADISIKRFVLAFSTWDTSDTSPAPPSKGVLEFCKLDNTEKAYIGICTRDNATSLRLYGLVQPQRHG